MFLYWQVSLHQLLSKRHTIIRVADVSSWICSKRWNCRCIFMLTWWLLCSSSSIGNHSCLKRKCHLNTSSLLHVLPVSIIILWFSIEVSPSVYKTLWWHAFCLLLLTSFSSSCVVSGVMFKTVSEGPLTIKDWFLAEIKS